MPRPYPAALRAAHLTEAMPRPNPTAQTPCLRAAPRAAHLTEATRATFGRGTASPLRDHDHGSRSLPRFEVSVHLLRLVQPIAMVDIDLDTPALDRIKQ